MSAQKSLKFTDFNVDNFSAFLDNAAISKGSNHCISINPDIVNCRASPVDNRYIKYTALKAIDVLKFDAFPSGMSPIVLKFVSFKKISQSMDVYSMAKQSIISGEIFYHANDEGINICNHIKFKSNKINLTVRCDEDTMVKYITDAQWAKYSNRDDMSIKFDLDEVTLKQLKSLLSLDKQNAIVLFAEKDKLVLKSKTAQDEEGVWDLQYDGNYSYNNEDQPSVTYNISKMILESVTNKSFYTLYITRNKDGAGNVKLTALYFNDEDNIILSPVNGND